MGCGVSRATRLETSTLKVDALVAKLVAEGVGERHKVRHDTSKRPMEALGFRLLLNQRHNKNAKRVAAVLSKQQRGAGVQKRAAAWSRSSERAAACS